MSTLFCDQYTRPFPYFSSHMETIIPALFRKVKGLPNPERERIDTPDGDFLDLDWWKQGADKVVIIQHGLEGSSDRPYVLGKAKAFFQLSYDVLAWNFRGCSGEMNRTARFYHSGATDDLDLVVQHALKDYNHIDLVGFSLGGNLTLKYLGEAPRSGTIKHAVTISTPLDLDAGSDHLHTMRGRIYEKRFLRNLRKKVLKKAQVMPDVIDASKLEEVKTLRDFDDLYTAPLHGFKNAADYYRKCSSQFFLNGITVPTLIINAENDPFLTKQSLNQKQVENNPKVQLLTTTHGGHVGFTRARGLFWSEKMATDFCST